MASRVENRKKPVVGFMDIGTNSIRLLLARINPNHTFTTLTQHKETVRLGEGEFTQHRLRPAAITRAVQVCSRFARMARSFGAREIVAVATAATREARNRRPFVQRLKKEADLDIRVVSGKEEARLIWLGVCSGTNLADREAVFIDVGGGSTEVIVGDQQRYRYLDTLRLGAIRLQSMFFKAGETGPVSRGRYKDMQQYVRSTAIHTVQDVREYGPDLAIGSSGTIMNLADVAFRNFNDRPGKRKDVLVLSQLEQVAERLCSLSLSERRKIPGLNPERADIIIPGAAIVQTLLEELKLKQMRVSDRSMRDGLPLDYLARGEHVHPLRKTTFRENSVLQLGQACGFAEIHARNVARLALELFDSARLAGLHALGEWERDLLEYAALLHDVGTFLSFADHEIHSAYFIRHADLLGFDDTEIAILANTAMFHRRNAPRKKHPALADIDPASQEVIRVLSVLLRLSESLDRSHTGVIRHVRLRSKGRTKAVLEVRCNEDCQLEIWGVQNHLKVFRRIFGRDLSIEQVSAGGNRGRVPHSSRT
jgi:exopolyphosphatase / guanosine-5'-triphosphate,3'-diphosphate pyrophosphatase